MEQLTLYVTALVVAAALLAALTLWAPRKLWLKCLAIGLAAVVAVSAYAAGSALLSLPKNVNLGWMRTNAYDALVLGSHIVEEKGIYLLLLFPEHKVPRYYELPWSLKVADELQRKRRDARRKGVQLLLRFKKSLEQEEDDMFYPMPQIAPPPKEPPGDALQYERSQEGDPAK